MIPFIEKDRISTHLVFFSKIFAHNVEQRFSYWVVNLGFFLSTQTNYEKSFVLEKKNTVWVYFNFKKYFFSFLLLRLFLNFTFFKAIHKHSENFCKKSPVFAKRKNTKLINRRSINNNNKNIFKSVANKTLTVKSFKVLFLMTIPAQKLFVDKVFLSQTKHLSILVDQNLITNRYFFYKILLGFHKERKNMIYPQFAKRFSSPTTNFYSSFGFGYFLTKFNTFFTFKSGSVKIEVLRTAVSKIFFLGKMYLNKFAFFIDLISLNNFKIASAPFANLSAYHYFVSQVVLIGNYLTAVLNFFFMGAVACFWGLFWIKLFFNFFLQKDLSSWRNFSLLYFNDFITEKICDNSSISRVATQSKIYSLVNSSGGDVYHNTSSKKYFFSSSYFFNFMQKLSFSYFNKLTRSISTIKNFYLNNFNQRILQQAFIEKSFNRQDPKKLRDRQALLDKIILLRFLPITLVVLFVSAVNKQVLRDVFKMNLPFILVSSMDNKNLPSDYSFPGNSFEFNILYFYFKFFLEFFKT